MSTPAPALEDLVDLAVETLETVPLVVSNGLSVIKDEGLQDDDLAAQLTGKGVALVVLPILDVELRDQSGPATVTDADIVVRIITNPAVNPTGSGAQVDIYQLVREVKQTMTYRERHRGGEFFKLASVPVMLSAFSQGLWGYDMFFTKECVL